ncbi:MAG TPA: hypothetical protein VMD91_06845 [Candidatus Sulfotelmatobacter sp.]|nr:hypothetical protein [Candidatus Sulfotelmatobacter sp.]
MTTPRYRRSSVRSVLEAAVTNHVLSASIHDALWAVLWNRRHDDVDEPVWLPDSGYGGVLVFARALDDEQSLVGVDTTESLIVFRISGSVPALGSRVRVLPAARELWRLSDVHPLGLGMVLEFDDRGSTPDTAWVAPLREAVGGLRAIFEARRDRLAARRAELGALQEPPSIDAVWRDQIAGIGERAQMETELTPQEHTALQRARARGGRVAAEEERRINAIRQKRFAERANAEIARFRETDWPALRDRAAADLKRYTDYHAEIVRLEDALSRIRALTDRAAKAVRSLDAIERAEFRVRTLALDPARLEEAAYAEELLRTVELLDAAIPKRGSASASSFSAYRAPTAGPSVIPPRF